MTCVIAKHNKSDRTTSIVRQNTPRAYFFISHLGNEVIAPHKIVMYQPKRTRTRHVEHERN